MRLTTLAGQVTRRKRLESAIALGKCFSVVPCGEGSKFCLPHSPAQIAKAPAVSTTSSTDLSTYRGLDTGNVKE